MGITKVMFVCNVNKENLCWKIIFDSVAAILNTFTKPKRRNKLQASLVISTFF